MFDVDPQLFRGVAPAERDRARASSVARTVELLGPRWDPNRMVGDRQAREPRTEWLGLLIIEGVLVREVIVADRASSCELLAPGDLLRPWDSNTETELDLPNRVEWSVARRAAVALLDASFARRMAPWPTVTEQLMARLSRRIGEQAVSHALSHASSIEERLPAFFWLLAQRWGKAMPEGVRIDLPFTHRLLGSLVGARRPTVSLALGKLGEQGILIRQAPERWLLSWDAVERLTEVRGDGIPARLAIPAGERRAGSAGG